MQLKKSIALAGMTCAAAAAQAQSTVSITGVADLYAQRATGSLISRSMLSSGGNSTSKLYFRGTEDLGDGLKAGFWLEAGFSLDTGLGNATNTNNQPSGAGTASGLVFNRRAIVYLASPTWGEFQMGRNWSPTYDAFTARFDPFGVGSGIALNYKGSIDPNNVRVSNDVAYITPRFHGLSANIQHWFGENPSGTPTASDGSGDGIKLNYDNGPFGAVAAYARTHFAAGDAIYRDAAVVYDFGQQFKVSANYNQDQQGALKQRGFMLGAWWFVGLGDIKASYSRLTTNAAGSPKGEKFAVGYVYNFSKRTAWYTTLAHIRNSNGSAFAIDGSTTAANHSSNGFDLGVRHSF